MSLGLRRNKNIGRDYQQGKDNGEHHPNESVSFTKGDRHFSFFIGFRNKIGQSNRAAGRMINLKPAPEWAASASILSIRKKQNQTATNRPMIK
jgi:hypothetical protein